MDKTYSQQSQTKDGFVIVVIKFYRLGKGYGYSQYTPHHAV